MGKLIRFWNQNRKKIIIIIGLIVFVIIIIQLLNQVTIEKKQQEQQALLENNQEEEEDLPNKSIITGEKIETDITKENTNLINEFVEYCNSKEIEKAYDLLTDECKKTLFANEQEFVDYYYNMIFTETRIIDLENFRNANNYYTYAVEYHNDIMSTGKVSTENMYKDYITIDKNVNKLNINSFIYSKPINKTSEYNGITIEVKEQQIYKDYEKYVISVNNSTSKKILLDTRQNSRSIYVLGNSTKYSAFANEILDTMYEIPEHYTKTYTFKFDKIYNPNIKSKKIGFTDIVTDFEAYKANPEQENRRTKIIVEF